VIIKPFGNNILERAEDDTLVGGKTTGVDKRTVDPPSFVVATSLVELMLSQPSVSLVSSPNTSKDIEGIEHVCYDSGRRERVGCVDRLIQTVEIQS
jgi:hypothetical protein